MIPILGIVGRFGKIKIHNLKPLKTMYVPLILYKKLPHPKPWQYVRFHDPVFKNACNLSILKRGFYKDDVG